MKTAAQGRSHCGAINTSQLALALAYLKLSVFFTCSILPG